MTTSKNEKVAQRLASILVYLNEGRRLNLDELAAEFAVSKRTLQKDLNERFCFLRWKEKDNGYYSLERNQLGSLTQADIQRFAHFASIQNLFPKIDRTFYQESLIESVQVKGFQYENISQHQQTFNDLQTAIENKLKVRFFYQKFDHSGKNYQLEPYSLINKNGIWYLIGLENGKEKTFCFSQIKTLLISQEKFEVNPEFLQQIKQSDSIYHGNQLTEVIIKVSKKAAPYFLRRNLLPNQETIKKLDDGGLLLQCKNINEMEIIPLVQYWVPHLTIISPTELQEKMEEKLKCYIKNK